MLVNRIQNKYSLSDKVFLLYSLILTKLIWPKARIIRRPFIIRGKSMIDLGRGLTTGVGCRLEAFITGQSNQQSKLIFGDRVQLNDYVHLSAIDSIRIGNDVLMASHVYISDNSHGLYKGTVDDSSPDVAPVNRPYYVAPVHVGDRVWIGEGAIIMPGVTIGEGAIIGAHSIVNTNIPDNSIAVGSPAKVIKKWNDNLNKWEKI